MALTAAAKLLVVDAGGFICNVPIKEIGNIVYTVPAVVNESCDKATRLRLQVLPYTIHFKKPSAEAISYVSDFAKKTGDYRHLSHTDIQLLALTYMLEKENSGKLIKHNIDDVAINEDTTALGGSDIEHLFDKNDAKCINLKSMVSHDVSKVEEIGLQKEDIVVSSECWPSFDCSDDKELCDQGGCNILTEKYIEEDALLERIDELEVTGTSDGNGTSEDADSDGNGEWFTPSNIDQMKLKCGEHALGEKKHVDVACLTTDFAMQNVLIRMGLNVVSCNGLIIKKTKSWVLRCYTCRKIMYRMDKEFCFNCGNKTLKRVSMTIQEDGTQTIYISRRPLSLKGKKFPLPLPKGGKHANNPQLVEDQPMPQQRMSRKAREKMDILGMDFISGSSPFAIHDTTSRAAIRGISGKHDIKNSAYWNRRNPNQALKHSGRRK